MGTSKSVGKLENVSTEPSGNVQMCLRGKHLGTLSYAPLTWHVLRRRSRRVTIRGKASAKVTGVRATESGFQAGMAYGLCTDGLPLILATFRIRPVVLLDDMSVHGQVDKQSRWSAERNIHPRYKKDRSCWYRNVADRCPRRSSPQTQMNGADSVVIK